MVTARIVLASVCMWVVVAIVICGIRAGIRWLIVAVTTTSLSMIRFRSSTTRRVVAAVIALASIPTAGIYCCFGAGAVSAVLLWLLVL